VATFAEAEVEADPHLVLVEPGFGLGTPLFVPWVSKSKDGLAVPAHRQGEGLDFPAGAGLCPGLEYDT
jgi:hypothetical protein